MAKKILLVIPCYNEAAILEKNVALMLSTLKRIAEAGKISDSSGILLVDDGSSDATWEIISRLQSEKRQISGIKLAGNRGHQFALFSGLMAAKDCADAAISMDADLQDDIDVIEKFVDDFNGGSDIVYGVRNNRDSDSFFKRNTALLFYKIMSFLGVKSIYNHADYRLMSHAALEALSQFGEVNLYLRGIVPLLGFRQSIVLYERKATERPTHYSFKKMLMLAIDGITSFSVMPIRLITALGLVMFILSMLLLIYYFIVYLCGDTVRGWTSMIFVMLLIGGIQLLCVGIIGEYIGKIYTEVKHRPRYIEEKRCGNFER